MRDLYLDISAIKGKMVSNTECDIGFAPWKLLLSIAVMSVGFQLLLPHTTLQILFPYNQIVFLFGIFVCFGLVILYIFTSKLKAVFVKNSKFTASLMLLMALIVAISTFIPPQNAGFIYGHDIIHSFLFYGFCGALSAGLIISVWQVRKTLKNIQTLSIAIIHLGSVVFLTGIGLSSSFGLDGLLNMHVDQTASEFNLMKNNIPTLNTQALPQKMKLTNFITEYYPEEYKLRVYQSNNGGYDLVQSLNFTKGGKVAVGESEIEMLNFYPEFSVEYKVIEQTTDERNPTSGLMVVIDNGSEKQSGWVFATDKNNGWLEGGGILGLLTRGTLTEALDSLRLFNSSNPASSPINSFIVSAREKAYAVIKENDKNPQILTLQDFPLHIQLADYQLTFENLYQNSKVETIYKTVSDSLVNPVIELNVKINDIVTPYLLSPFEPQPVTLGANKFLLYEKPEPEPKLFKSTVEVYAADPNEQPTIHELTVNTPLTMGDYKIYQADFRKNDPTFSGFTISYDPGKKVVMLGLLVMILGSLVYFIKLTVTKGKTA